MWRGISLANKCLLLFGGAVVLIVLVALSVPWFRMNTLVDLGQRELSRELVKVWHQLHASTPVASRALAASSPEGVEHAGIRARMLTVEQARAESPRAPFVGRVLRSFQDDRGVDELQDARWAGITREYHYARAIRDEGSGELVGVIILQRRPYEAARLLAINTAYLTSAGFFVLGLAVLVFYFITHKIILSPVRSLRQTAERVREGDLATRSDIVTGDEFEDLSDTFNAMLAGLQGSQDRLRATNSALDVKLTELAEANSSLFQAAKLKGEFVASVSHELRTPLNAIIGFAELLRDTARTEQEAGDDSSRLSKRLHYLENISTAGRRLLEMINDLLEMAKLEAGKVELNVQQVVLREALEGLLGLAFPLAQRKGLELTLEAADDLPAIQTDLKRFQQVVFNFLSNAVKFTPSVDRDGRAGRVTLRAERLPGRGPEAGEADERVRVSVIDTGPGITAEDQARLFQKFQQIDASHTREHAGSGLGLAISREISLLLQGEIQMVSEPGRGSMFSLILPLTIDAGRTAEHQLENQFRGTLAGRRAWTV